MIPAAGVELDDLLDEKDILQADNSQHILFVALELGKHRNTLIHTFMLVYVRFFGLREDRGE